MIPGIDYLRRAKAVLTEATEPKVREDLHVAARLFWSAVFHDEHWPATLNAKADSLKAILFAHGPLSATIPRMSPSELEHARAALLEFIEAAVELDGASPSTRLPGVRMPDH